MWTEYVGSARDSTYSRAEMLHREGTTSPLGTLWDEPFHTQPYERGEEGETKKQAPKNTPTPIDSSETKQNKRARPGGEGICFFRSSSFSDRDIDLGV